MKKMIILGMRGGPGSWIGQDYRGVYWRYWVGSGEPPTKRTETKRKGGREKKERREQEKKKVRMNPRKKGGGKIWTSRIQSGTTYHNNNCSHSILFFLVFPRLTPQYFIPFFHLEIQLKPDVKKVQLYVSVPVPFATLRASTGSEYGTFAK